VSEAQKEKISEKILGHWVFWDNLKLKRKFEPVEFKVKGRFPYVKKYSGNTRGDKPQTI
jgi:hypothetical protein